jgi:hypothetical protein
MKIKMVVVDLELSSRAKRIAAAVAVPLLVLGGGAVAYANVPHTWKDGDVLKADELNENFTGLESDVANLKRAQSSNSSFLAHKTQTQSLQSGLGGGVTFDAADFDVAGEFDGSTFTTKTGGIYDVSCTLTWAVNAPGTIGHFGTIVWLNQNTMSGISAGRYGDINGASVEAHGIIKLSANDKLYCQAYQATGTSLSLLGSNSLTRFSAVRLSP